MNSSNALKSLLYLVVLCLGIARADVSVTVTTGTSAKYATSDGNLLPVGCVVRIGTFDTSGGNLATLQTSNDFLNVDALFTPLGEGIAGAGSILETGATGNNLVINWTTGTLQMSGQITGINASYLSTGAPLYAWVFNTVDPTTATEWGIFAAPAFWSFPTEFTATTLSTRRVSDVIRGNATGLVTDPASQLQLSSVVTPVPEPSGLLLLSFVGLGAIMRRSRRLLN
jgi:hypothetical protein